MQFNQFPLYLPLSPRSGILKLKSQKNPFVRQLLAAAAAKSFSCVRLCATPQMAAHQAPPPLGFSRQEHWSGLPFPSPMHESEKVKVKSLSHVRLLATPWTAAHQAPPSMGFSRQEYWSGVPLVAQLCPTLCNPMDCRPPGSSVHGILQARILEWLAISFSR